MKLWFTRQTVTKFILATAIFYAILAFNIFHIGENIIPVEKDYLSAASQAEMMINNTGDQYIQEAIRDIELQVHGAGENNTGDKIRIQTICLSNERLCKKIVFESPFSDRQRYIYISTIFHIVNFINEYLSTQQTTEDTLDKIFLNKDSGQRRWYATRDTIVLNLGYVSSNAEFLKLVTHEMAHILDLGILQWTNDTKSSLYTEFGETVFALDDISLKYYVLSRDNETIRKSTAVKKDFCSGYGMSDPFEDFAECFNLYLQHNTLFQTYAQDNKIMKRKYAFMSDLFDGNFLRKGNSSSSKDGRVRDTTKID